MGNDARVTVLERAPGSRLDGIVRRLWFLDRPTPGGTERILPIPYVHVIVNLGAPYTVVSHGQAPVGLELDAAFVSGLQSRALVNRNPPRLHHVGAELEPWAWRAFGVAPFADEVRPAHGLLPGLDGVRATALAAGDPRAALDALERALVGALTGERPDAGAVAIGRRIAADPGARIGRIAREAALDPASVARRFRAATGTTPKAHAGVHRLHAFVTGLARPGPVPTWTQLVADAPYYDQPDFNRDFARRVGVTPRDYLAALGEQGLTQPSFVHSDDDG